MQLKLLGRLNKAALAAALTRGKRPPANKIAYVEKIVGVKHHSSVSEFIVYSFELKGIRRDVARIIGSRRLLSPMETSQRYVAVKSEATEGYEKKAFDAYNKLITKYKWKKEDARYVLPTSILTNMTIMVNRRSLGTLIERLQESRIAQAKEVAKFLIKTAKEDGIFETWEPRKCKNVSAYKKGQVVEIMEPEQACYIKGRRAAEFIDVIVSDKLSVSALEQLKRHRIASLVVDDFAQRKSFYIPQGYKVGTGFYKKTIAAAGRTEINASMKGFTLKINMRSLANLKNLRTNRHAQTEIREWSTPLCDDLAEFLV